MTQRSQFRCLLVALTAFILVSGAPVFAATTGQVGGAQVQAARCFGEIVSVANVSRMIDEVDQAAQEILLLQADDKLGRDLTQLAANYDTALEFLDEFKEEGSTKEVGERCFFASYSCTQWDTGGATHAYSKQQCARCGPVQPTPPTNPVTCTTSCTLCCTSFGGTDPLTDCGCDENDAC